MRQPYIKRLLAPSACLVLILVVSQGRSAQAAGSEGGARKFDAFNRIGGCDLGARLDNFAIALMNDENVSGHLISYGPEGEGPGTGSYNLLVMTDYLVNNRGIDKERLRTVYGGRNKDPKELATELWLVPSGAQPPEPEKYKNKLKSFQGKYDEYFTSDQFYAGVDDAGTGPYPGDPSFASFIDALRQQTATRAYIVVRSSPRATTGAWRRVAKGIAERLQEGSGITDDRVKIIFAGYDKKLAPDDEESEYQNVKVQLWILPEDAPPPAKEVKTERRPSEAVQIGALSDYQLRHPDNEKRIFEGLADVLKADGELRACIIYRLSTRPPDPEIEPDPTPPVDLNQLVGKWKAELATKYKIDESRLVVISAAATRDWDEGTLEAWVVPPGATLPDAYPPQEREEEYVEEAAEGNTQGL